MHPMPPGLADEMSLQHGPPGVWDPDTRMLSQHHRVFKKVFPERKIIWKKIIIYLQFHFVFLPFISILRSRAFSKDCTDGRRHAKEASFYQSKEVVKKCKFHSHFIQISLLIYIVYIVCYMLNYFHTNWPFIHQFAHLTLPSTQPHKHNRYFLESNRLESCAQDHHTPVMSTQTIS